MQLLISRLSQNLTFRSLIHCPNAVSTHAIPLKPPITTHTFLPSLVSSQPHFAYHFLREICTPIVIIHAVNDSYTCRVERRMRIGEGQGSSRFWSWEGMFRVSYYLATILVYLTYFWWVLIYINISVFSINRGCSLISVTIVSLRSSSDSKLISSRYKFFYPTITTSHSFWISY